MGRTLEKRTLSSQIADEVRELVITGALAPGEKVKEQALAERFEVSRAAVREALRQLVGERLLVSEPQRGVRVWQPSAEELRDLLDYRAALEGMSARLCFERGRKDDLIFRLRDRVKKIADVDVDGDDIARAAAHAAFHEEIIVASGSSQIVRAWRDAHPAVWLADLAGFLPPESEPASHRHDRLLQLLSDATTPVEAQEVVLADTRSGLELNVNLRP